MKVLPQAFDIFRLEGQRKGNSFEEAVVVESCPCTAKLQNQQTEVGEGICCWSLDCGKVV